MKQSDLRERILGLLTSRKKSDAAMPAPAPADSAGARPASRNLRILVAEDNPINQRVAAKLLERQGHAVTVVGDGRQALAALEQRWFDLVFMDVQMPEMDGMEATAAIRSYQSKALNGEVQAAPGSSFAPGEGARARIPIVAMTAHSMAGDREECLAAGMDEYISKPIHANELYRLIEELGGAARGIPVDTIS